MTPGVKEGIVETMARCFAPVPVARAFGISYECYRLHLRSDPAFRAGIDEARRYYVDLLRCEVHRRAVEGWEVPVFRRGKQVGVSRRYSDRLLLRHAASFDPAYRKTTTAEHRVRTRLPIPATGRLGNLSAEVREQLRAVARALRGHQLSSEGERPR
jgi:hypothetical protein